MKIEEGKLKLFASGSILTFAIFLRILFGLLGNIFDHVPKINILIFEYGSLICILLLLIINWNNLQEYYIDKIMVSITLASLLITGFQQQANLILWLIFLVLFLTLTSKIHVFQLKNTTKFRQVFLGIIVIIFLSFFLSLPSYLPVYLYIGENPKTLFAMILRFIFEFPEFIVLNINKIVLFEEIIFRSFVIGFLVKFKINGKIVLIVQTLIFMGAHTYLQSSPYSFFIILPVISFILGYFLLRWENSVPSLLAHAVYNYIVYFLVSVYR